MISRRKLLLGSVAAAASAALPEIPSAGTKATFQVGGSPDGGFPVPPEMSDAIMRLFEADFKTFVVRISQPLDRTSEITSYWLGEIPSRKQKERKVTVPKFWNEKAKVEVMDLLKSGVEVNLTGIGKIEMISKAARVARNPHTGEKVNVPAKRVAKFRQSSVLTKVFEG